ncbi:489_t:CDS:2 [Entrophospora sp. SA101]|nr:23086_t:CDS:2 [Entrophospora sp. SA101]CAJ0764182.1 489_t:CDS:2 [Entrophospora sp. SA101]
MNTNSGESSNLKRPQGKNSQFNKNINKTDTESIKDQLPVTTTMDWKKSCI